MAVKYTKDILHSIIKISLSWADVCRHLNVRPATGAQSYITKRAAFFQIDSSHFLGQAHGRGKPQPKKFVLDYCYKGSRVSSSKLREKLIRDKIKKPECETCGVYEWMGEPVVLELDHIDNDHTNNELGNLQILCPNCHAQKTRRNRSKNV